MDCDELIDELLSAQSADDRRRRQMCRAKKFARKRWENTVKGSLHGRGRPSQTVLGKSFYRSSDWRSGWCRNRSIICPLRGEAWGDYDEDAGVCSAPALCGVSIHVFPNRKPTSACCWLRGPPVCLACTYQCYLRALPPLWYVPCTANRCTKINDALPIWTSMPSDNKRWWRTNRWRKRWKEWWTKQLLTLFRRRLKTREQKTQRK